jgi:Esterase FrsA-like
MSVTDETLVHGSGPSPARRLMVARAASGSSPSRGCASRSSRARSRAFPATAAWGALAEKFATRARNASDQTTQHDMWLQAYRAAFMGRYPVPNHPLKAEQYARARNFFRNATVVEDPPLDVIEIPFAGRAGEGDRLRFYLTRPKPGGPRPPVAMVWAGIDTWKEEMHGRLGALLRSRGFAVLLVDMPGVGESPVLASRDAERQWTPIFDWLSTRDDLDAQRCAAIVGSFGGYWAMILRVDDRLQQCRPSTRAVVGCIHIEHIQLPRPRRRGVQRRARHRDPDQVVIPLGYSNAVLAIALVGQRGSPKPLPSSQEARVIEHRVRHEPSIALLPAPDVHARHLGDVLDPGRTNRQRGTHRRIVGRPPPTSGRSGVSTTDALAARRSPGVLRHRLGRPTAITENGGIDGKARSHDWKEGNQGHGSALGARRRVQGAAQAHAQRHPAQPRRGARRDGRLGGCA